MTVWVARIQIMFPMLIGKCHLKSSQEMIRNYLLKLHPNDSTHTGHDRGQFTISCLGCTRVMMTHDLLSHEEGLIYPR